MGNEPTTIVKDRFTALDTLALSRELRALQGARVDKVFDVPPNGFSIAFRIPRAGRPQLLLVPGRYAALVPDTERAESLSPLARELRRLLTGCRLGLAHALGGERFLEVEFEGARGDPPSLLVIELFGPGNLLVVNDGRIVAVQHVKTWAHRTVRIGATYERPPARLDPWKATVPEIEAVLSASRTDRATTVAARLSLGGPVAEELLVRAGLEGSAPATTEPDRSAIALKDAIEELLSAVGERPTGHLYRRDELWIDVEPFSSERLRRDPSIVEEQRPSFSEAARLFFDSLVPTGPPVPDREALARAELLRQRDQMALAVEELSREAKRLTEDAELLLARFPEADALRSAAERQDPEGRGPIELSLDGRRIRVRRDRPLRESAQALFEESKRVRVKLEGARAALGTTEAKMASGRALAESRSALAPSTPPRRTLWFERYRWFLSSEGVLVIGGRDAVSNDQLVRRYLKDADLYVHAEIHGAPSVIVKHPSPGQPAPTEATMEEAAQWGVAFSKAWRVGLASASAFWVSADQVSKSAGTGEFVPRGAWVIHGSKHVLKDLPTELGIGMVDYEGSRLWSVAPPRSLERRGSLLARLRPGEERSRAEREIELAERLGLPRSRLQAMLPAGGLSVRFA